MSLGRPTGSGRARLLSRPAKVLTAVTGLATLGGWPARPSHHFVILEDSENGKVQKVSPKGINKGRLPWATKINIFTDKRNVLDQFRGFHFVIWEVSWPGFPSET